MGWGDLPTSSTDIPQIDGDPSTLRSCAEELGDLALDLTVLWQACDGLGDIGDELTWQGESQQAYMETVDRNPKGSDIDGLQAAFREAGAAIETLATKMADAQSTIEWCRNRIDDLGIYVPDDGLGGSDTSGLPPETIAELESIAADAQAARDGWYAARDEAAEAFVALRGNAVYTDPPVGFWDEQWWGFNHFQVQPAVDFFVGAWDETRDMAVGLWDLGVWWYTTPGYTLYDKALNDPDVMNALVQMAIAHAENPGPVWEEGTFWNEMGKAAINWDLLMENPAKWAGHLLPGIVLTVATFGAGAAVAGSTTAVSVSLRFTAWLTRFGGRVTRVSSSITRLADNVAAIPAGLRGFDDMVGLLNNNRWGIAIRGFMEDVTAMVMVPATNAALTAFSTIGTVARNVAGELVHLTDNVLGGLTGHNHNVELVGADGVFGRTAAIDPADLVLTSSIAHAAAPHTPTGSNLPTLQPGAPTHALPFTVNTGAATHALPVTVDNAPGAGHHLDPGAGSGTIKPLDVPHIGSNPNAPSTPTDSKVVGGAPDVDDPSGLPGTDKPDMTDTTPVADGGRDDKEMGEPLDYPVDDPDERTNRDIDDDRFEEWEKELPRGQGDHAGPTDLTDVGTTRAGDDSSVNLPAAAEHHADVEAELEIAAAVGANWAPAAAPGGQAATAPHLAGTRLPGWTARSGDGAPAPDGDGDGDGENIFDLEPDTAHGGEHDTDAPPPPPSGGGTDEPPSDNPPPTPSGPDPDDADGSDDDWEDEAPDPDWTDQDASGEGPDPGGYPDRLTPGTEEWDSDPFAGLDRFTADYANGDAEPALQGGAERYVSGLEAGEPGSHDDDYRFLKENYEDREVWPWDFDSWEQKTVPTPEDASAPQDPDLTTQHDGDVPGDPDHRPADEDASGGIGPDELQQRLADLNALDPGNPDDFSRGVDDLVEAVQGPVDIGNPDLDQYRINADGSYGTEGSTVHEPAGDELSDDPPDGDGEDPAAGDAATPTNPDDRTDDDTGAAAMPEGDDAPVTPTGDRPVKPPTSSSTTNGADEPDPGGDGNDGDRTGDGGMDGTLDGSPWHDLTTLNTRDDALGTTDPGSQDPQAIQEAEEHRPSARTDADEPDTPDDSPDDQPGQQTGPLSLLDDQPRPAWVDEEFSWLGEVNPSGDVHNCTNSAVAVDRRLAGDSSAVAPPNPGRVYGNQYLRWRTHRPDLWKMDDADAAREAIERAMHERLHDPESATPRGIVTALPPVGTKLDAHIFNVTVDSHGQVRYIDGQTGREANFERPWWDPDAGPYSGYQFMDTTDVTYDADGNATDGPGPTIGGDAPAGPSTPSGGGEGSPPAAAEEPAGPPQIDGRVPVGDLVADGKPNPADLPAVRAAISNLFEGHTFGRLECEVTNIGVFQTRGMTSFWGDIVHGGRPVGQFERALYLEDGQLHAVDVIRNIPDPDLRGQGIGTELDQLLEGWYREHGVMSIQHGARDENGAYAAARAGFNWQREQQARTIFQHLRTELHGPDVTHPERAAAEAILHRAEHLPFGHENYPTPYEITEIGRTEGARDHLGWRALLGQRFDGIKLLTDDGVDADAYEQALGGADAPEPGRDVDVTPDDAVHRAADDTDAGATVWWNGADDAFHLVPVHGTDGPPDLLGRSDGTVGDGPDIGWDTHRDADVDGDVGDAVDVSGPIYTSPREPGGMSPAERQLHDRVPLDYQIRARGEDYSSTSRQYLVIYEDGQGLYKPIAGECRVDPNGGGPLRASITGPYADRAVIFSRVFEDLRALDTEGVTSQVLVPTTTYHNGEEGWGSLMEWVPDTTPGLHSSMYRDLARFFLGTFDYAMGQLDRNVDNWATSPNGGIVAWDPDLVLPEDTSEPLRSQFIWTAMTNKQDTPAQVGRLWNAYHPDQLGQTLWDGRIPESAINLAIARLLELQGNDGMITGDAWHGEIYQR